MKSGIHIWQHCVTTPPLHFLTATMLSTVTRGGGRNALISSPNLLLSPQEIEKPSFFRSSYSDMERDPLNLIFLRERRHTLSRPLSEVSGADEPMP
jgi:hypothetical protein